MGNYSHTKVQLKTDQWLLEMICVGFLRYDFINTGTSFLSFICFSRTKIIFLKICHVIVLWVFILICWRLLFLRSFEWWEWFSFHNWSRVRYKIFDFKNWRKYLLPNSIKILSCSSLTIRHPPKSLIPSRHVCRSIHHVFNPTNKIPIRIMKPPNRTS